jgi:WD40 repeat protein
MSIFEELKPVKPRRRLSKPAIIILGVLLVVIILFFSYTNVGSDAAFVSHFVTPPKHFTYKGHTAYVSSVAWSPDGRYIASGSGDRTVQIWNASSGKLALTYRGHQTDVSALAWSKDGRYIASADINGIVQVWNPATGATLYTYRGHSDTVFAVAWSPDGTRIASASNDGTVQAWVAMTGKRIFSLSFPGRNSPPPWNCVSWSPDGRYIAAGGIGQVVVADAASGKPLSYYGYNGGITHTVAWSPDGMYLAFGGSDDSVHVWSVASHSSVYDYTGHNSDVDVVAWSPDGKRIASGDANGFVEVWDALTGKHVYTYRGHSDMYPGHFTYGSGASINGLAWSPDGKRIASASNDTTVQVWAAQ